MSNFDYLEKMGIYDLRNLGREVGVKSPTSKAKKEIIDEIIKIKTGLMEPAPKSKKGAPPKSSYMGKINLDSIEPKSAEPQPEKPQPETSQIKNHA
jgi:hypothetical protein